MRRILFLLIFVLGSTSLLRAASHTDFKAAVQAAAKEFNAALGAKDAARIGALYAQDAVALPPNSEMVKGKEAIQAFWKGFMDAGMSGKIEAVETESEGNIGMEVGKYTITDTSGKTVDQGKYVVVWKKGEGGWKLYRDIWNSSMPVAPPAK